MSEELFYVIGLIACLALLIIAVYKIIRVFKITKNNSDVTTCKFTHVLRIRYLFITFCIRYDFEYVVEGVTFTNKVLVFPLSGFSDSDLENGVPVRYLKWNPNCVEFTNSSRAARVFGWLVIIAACVTGAVFSFLILSGI